MIAAALDLATSGWSVHPLAGKHPATQNGFKDATTNVAIITEWWTKLPNANIGIAIPDHLLVIDLDPRNGGLESWKALADTLGHLPRTLTSRSGRGDGGGHLWFHRPRGDLRSKLPDFPGIDIKLGGKGYVVAPPSLHPETGQPYAWVNDDPVAQLPGAFIDLIRRTAPTPTAPRPMGRGDGSPLVQYVAGLQPGKRNDGLFWAACAAKRDGLLDRIEPDLLAAARAIGLDDREARTTIKSARRTA